MSTDFCSFCINLIVNKCCIYSKITTKMSAHITYPIQMDGNSILTIIKVLTKMTL